MSAGAPEAGTIVAAALAVGIVTILAILRAGGLI